MKTRNELYQYWLNPPAENTPAHYLKKKSSPFLVGLVREFLPDTRSRILEIGCNVGRNLNHLWNAKYMNLSGIEINPEAVRWMKKKYPSMTPSITVGAVEDCIDLIPMHDLIFSMAVFCHIHPDSSFIFKKIAERAGRFIITIEDEHNNSTRHTARNYKCVFGAFGFTQIKYCHNVTGMNCNYHARVLEKR
jgi:SAM-dependent methyltransferase